jgi:transposase
MYVVWGCTVSFYAAVSHTSITKVPKTSENSKHKNKRNAMSKSLSARVETRVKIKAFINAGWPNQRIAREVKCHIDTVKRWRKGFAAGKSGQEISTRPFALTKEQKQQVVTRARSKRKRSLRKIAKFMEQKKGIKVSRETIRRTLTDAGLHPSRRSKRPKLTKKHKADRVTFCQKRKKHNWTRTLMTDETEYALYQVPNTHNDVMWVRRGESAPDLELVAHSPKVKLWAGVSKYGRTQLHFYTGSLTWPEYVKTLTKALPEMQEKLGTRNWTFQHDGAPAHKAAKTNEWLQQNVPYFISSGPAGEWPANSPDLNWIENIWAVMSDKIDEPRSPTTVRGLKTKLKNIWKSLPDSLFENCVKDMPNRLQEVIDTQGQALAK